MGLNGLEPSTSRLSGVRSNQLSYRPFLKKAGEENRTPDISLEGWGFTTKLHPHGGSDGIWTRDLLRDRQACWPLHHGTMRQNFYEVTLWAFAQVYHACKLLKQRQSWQLRGQDLNLWPPGYEPGELPTAPPRDNE